MDQTPITKQSETLVINTKTLVDAIKYHQTVIESKSINPLFEHVRISVANSELSISSTNGEMLLENKVWLSDNTGSFVFTAPSKVLYNFLRNVQSKEVKITLVDNNIVEIQYQKSNKIKLSTLDYSTWPLPNLDQKWTTFSIKSTDLLNGLQTVKTSILNRDLRQILSGICIEAKNDMLHYVATDLHKLSYQMQQLKDVSLAPTVIPRKFANVMTNILRDMDQEVVCKISDTHVVCTIGEVSIVSRLLSGHFPNYQGVVPANKHTGHLTCNTESIKLALSRIVCLMDETSKSIALDLSPDTIQLTTSNVLGSANEQIHGTYVGQPIHLKLNGESLLEFVRLLEVDVLHMYYYGPSQPIKFHISDFGFHIMMPMT